MKRGFPILLQLKKSFVDIHEDTFNLKCRPMLPVGKQLGFLHPYVSSFGSQKSRIYVVGTSDSCMFCSMFLMFV